MSSELNQPSKAAWHVVRTRPKGEHIAAGHLKKYAHLDQVFCPRIKFEKATTIPSHDSGHTMALRLQLDAVALGADIGSESLIGSVKGESMLPLTPITLMPL